MKTSEQVNEISKAISQMQAEMSSALKDTKAYNYKYADFSAIWDVLRVPMTKNGLMVIQDAFSSPEGPSVITKVFHVSGQWIETSVLTIPLEKKGPQAYGAGLTYGKRYQLCALMGIIADEDDDANSIEPKKKNNVIDLTKKNDTTDEDDEFIKEWCDYFSPDIFNGYLNAIVKSKNVTKHQAIARFQEDIEIFKKNVQAWSNGQSKTK